MDDENRSGNTKKVEQDIATIKSLLLEVEEKPIIDIWAFFSWGGLFLLGSLIHIIIYKIYNPHIGILLLRLWTPIMLISMMLETVAMIKRISRESLPFFSRSMIKFIMTAMGMLVSMFFITFIILKMGGVIYIATIALILFGTFMLLYAQTVNFNLYFFSYFLIFAGIILYFLNLTVHIQTIVTGIILGIIFIGAGINLIINEKIKLGDS